MPRPENFDEILAGGWRHMTPDGLRTVIDYVQELENEKLARGFLEPERRTLIRECVIRVDGGAMPLRKIETAEVELAWMADCPPATIQAPHIEYSGWMLGEEE